MKLFRASVLFVARALGCQNNAGNYLLAALVAAIEKKKPRRVECDDKRYDISLINRTLLVVNWTPGRSTRPMTFVCRRGQQHCLMLRHNVSHKDYFSCFIGIGTAIVQRRRCIGEVNVQRKRVKKYLLWLTSINWLNSREVC